MIVWALQKQNANMEISINFAKSIEKQSYIFDGIPGYLLAFNGYRLRAIALNLPDYGKI